MTAMSKEQPLISTNGIDQPEFRSTRTEKINIIPNRTEPPQKRRRFNQPCEPAPLSDADRTVLRSQYNAIRKIIDGESCVEEKEELCNGDSGRFQEIMREVNLLHQHVTNPREQVKDAETLLDMARILLATVKSYTRDGITPFSFISSLIRDFGAVHRRVDDERVSIDWNTIGLLVCPMFKKAQGCPTMIGPMNAHLKQRKPSVRKRGTRLGGDAARPEQLEDSGSEQKTDTDKNMATMFNILRNKKRVCLENLVLNRFSFAQTVENLFALSFLVKDGRAQITVDDKGNHLVSPRNAPVSDLVTSGEVSFHHFVFRFDFKDWKLMVGSVASGEELMPHRYQVSIPLSQADSVSSLTRIAIPTKPLTEVQSSSENLANLDDGE